MSYGTSDSTVISSPNPEAHNLHSTNASTASRDDSSPANLHDNTTENRQVRLHRKISQSQVDINDDSLWSYS